MSRTSCLMIVGTFLTAVGCESKRDEATTRDETPGAQVPAQTTRTDPAQGAPAPDPAPDPATAQELSDAEIAAIGSTAHQIEIEAARLATSKAENPEVKAFAEQMIRDHSKALEEGQAAAKELGLSPEPSEMTAELEREAAATTARLQGLSGAEFDKAYMTAQVKDHQKVLDALDNKLIPGADAAALKTRLGAVRTVVADHLEHAKKLETQLQEKP